MTTMTLTPMGASPFHATVDAAGMRAQNSSLLLKVIWRERHISRADIARVTGLSPSTVSAIVAGLQQAGLVRETGAGLSRGGRRPTMIGFCDDVFALVGVEIGASHVTVVVIFGSPRPGNSGENPGSSFVHDSNYLRWEP